MAAAIPQSRHELDDHLADKSMFAWYVPMFRLAFKNWPISLACGLAALALQRLLAYLPWLVYRAPWWMPILSSCAAIISTMMLAVVAYRFLAQREGVGTVNEWGVVLVRALQIATIWLAAAVLAVGAVLLIAAGIGLGVQPDSAEDLFAFGVGLALVIGIGGFLLMPIWFSIAVASALSNAYAVRSLEGGLGAVRASLQLAFGQKWRVFWPSYLLATLAIALYVAAFFLQTRFYTFGPLLAQFTTFATTALGVTMTFVIERAYAPHLTMFDGAEPGAALPSRDSPASARQPRVRPQPAPVGPLPTAPQEIAALLAADLQANRLQRLVETVEHGLNADARFFFAHPDHTLAVAKRLSAAQRSDLALRIVQPYLKEHRAHRQHLTVALFAATLLRDLARLQDAAKFLTQVKALYPQEPMVDQLIKITDKAIAAAGAGDAAPAR
jgi:hypothetical protein